MCPNRFVRVQFPLEQGLRLNQLLAFAILLNCVREYIPLEQGFGHFVLPKNGTVGVIEHTPLEQGLRYPYQNSKLIRFL